MTDIFEKISLMSKVLGVDKKVLAEIYYEGYRSGSQDSAGAYSSAIHDTLREVAIPGRVILSDLRSMF